MRGVVLLLLPLLAACGQPAAELARAPAQTSPPAVDAAALLAGVPAAAERGRSVRYVALTESSLDGEPTTVDARMSGELDTTAGAGTATLELAGLQDLALDAAAAGEQGPAADLDALANVELAWTATTLTLHMGGEKVGGPRDKADRGVFGRIPGEPAGLFDVVAAATEIDVVGEEDVDGASATHLRGSAKPGAAADAGLGTQAQLSIAKLPTLPVEVWVDGEGRPLRIRYTVTLPSLQEGRLRTMVTTYDYRDWGKPVDVAP